MNQFVKSCELVSQLTSLATKNIKSYEKYKALALAQDSYEMHSLAQYFQGRYDAYAMARDMVVETLGYNKETE